MSVHLIPGDYQCKDDVIVVPRNVARMSEMLVDLVAEDDDMGKHLAVLF